MARSAVAKGSYYKGRTVTWLEAQGYKVGHLERMFLIHKSPARLKPGESPTMPVKRDQFASDLLAVNAEQILFVQVKLGRDGIWKARAEFATFPCPPPARQWIVIWERGAREPEVIDVTGQQRVSAGPDASKARRSRRPRTGLLF